MNRTLNDIDKSLTESKTKMKTDLERSLRGLNFGKLYLKNGEYDTALNYAKSYLNVRPNSSEGHKLLAQIYEAIGQDDTAVFNYKKALDLKKNSNENYLSSIQSPITTQSMTEPKRVVENNSIHSVETTPVSTPITTPIVRRERSIEKTEKSQSCGTCISNQSVLNKVVKQNESLLETNKTILEILKQNSHNIIDIQNQIVSMTEALNNLTDSQNLMKDTLYDYMAQEEHQDFEDYLLDDKENESLDASGLLAVSNDHSSQWHSSGLQLLPTVDQNKPLSELFKPPANSWQCEACYVQNKGSDVICVSCTTPKPGAQPIQPVTAPISEPPKSNFSFGNAQPFPFKASGATNTSTGFTFDSSINTTPSLESNTIFSNTNFKFGNSSVTPAFGSLNTTPPQFGFQLNKTTDNNKSPQNLFSGLNSSQANPFDNKSSSFQFGLSRTFDFEFLKMTKEEPKVEPEVVVKEEEQANLSDLFVEPSNADNIYFQPVVPLPPKIEVKTGEEEEDLLYSCRARLFRFDSEWKERGVGELKILQSRDTKKIRLLMRRDTIFKVCLNQNITNDLKLDLKEDQKSMTWSAIDYSEDVPNPQLFLLRLKNAENTQLFLNAFENAKKALKSDASPLKEDQTIAKLNLKNEIKPIETIVDPKMTQKDEDIEIIYEKRPESEDILKKVRELKLPLNFYDYEKMSPCPGCRGCKEYEYPLFSKTNSEPKSQPISTEKTTNETPESIQESLFGSAIKATNITQTDWNTSAKGQQIWQSNAPAPIFGSPSHDDVFANPDIYFKPLIPLPDLVEVKTGEEDETLIYSHRAKLFRYDPQTNEWKERGVGDFKILKHKDKNRYRMVLRRDQILKIACNHYITSSVNLKPMTTSETTVCWYAIDYTDGNPVEEKFALKFKNKEILKEFESVFEDCKSKLDRNEDNNTNGDIN